MSEKRTLQKSDLEYIHKVSTEPPTDPYLMEVIEISERVFKLVVDYFKGDEEKAWGWLNAKNPLLGDVSPWEMIKQGRHKRLLEFVESQLDDN